MSCLVLYFVFLVLLKCANGLNEDCTKNSDCSTINSLCIEGLCKCDALSYYSDTKAQCLQFATEYNAICDEEEQCTEWLGNNSTCKHNRCVCIDNNRWYKGQCQSYVDKDGECNSNDECFNGYDLLSLSCSSKGRCDCSQNYYDRTYDCRSSSTLFGDCAIDLDCRLPFYICKLGRCALKVANSSQTQDNLFESFQEKVNLIPSKNSFVFGDDKFPCEHDDDCVNMANSLCDLSNKTCGCVEDTHYVYNGNCVQGLSHCETDDDCSDISNNAMCFKSSSCICKPGFFQKDKNCIAELGMKDLSTDYSTDNDCPIKPGKLVDAACYCRNYWFNDESNRNCIKTMIQPTHNCLTNEWCAAMGPYSFCNSTSNTCQCSSIAKFNEKTYYCEKESDDSDICLRDIDCKINEHCLDEKCECLDNFGRNGDNICVPNIGGSCLINSCSHIGNSYCVGGTCRCDPNYIGKETRCLEMADSLETPCEEQEQCQKIFHSVCGESEPDIEYTTPEYNGTRCICEEGYTDINEVCLQVKKYGDPCMAEADCTLVLNRSYKCRNSLCQCDVGQTLKNGYCTSGGKVLLASSLLWLVVLAKIGLF